MRTLVLIFLVFIVVPGCKKDQQPLIPYVYVNLQLYPNSMDYISVSDYKYVDAGYRGIVVYRLSMDQFMVYERCCPYDPEKPNARITVNPDHVIATDSVCGSQYNLLDGSPLGNGPSPYSLMQYKSTYDGEVLYIYN